MLANNAPPIPFGRVHDDADDDVASSLTTPSDQKRLRWHSRASAQEECVGVPVNRCMTLVPTAALTPACAPGGVAFPAVCALCTVAPGRLPIGAVCSGGLCLRIGMETLYAMPPGKELSRDGCNVDRQTRAFIPPVVRASTARARIRLPVVTADGQR